MNWIWEGVFNFRENLIVKIGWWWVLSHFLKLNVEFSESPGDWISEITISNDDLGIVDVRVGQNLIWVTKIKNNAPGILLFIVASGDEVRGIFIIWVQDGKTNLGWDQISNFFSFDFEVNVDEIIFAEWNGFLYRFSLLQFVAEASWENSSLYDLKLEIGESPLGDENNFGGLFIELLVFVSILLENEVVGTNNINTLGENNLEIEFWTFLVSFDLRFNLKNLSLTILKLNLQ